MLPVYTLHLHCSMGHWDRDTRCILPVRDVCVVHVPGYVCMYNKNITCSTGTDGKIYLFLE